MKLLAVLALLLLTTVQVFAEEPLKVTKVIDGATIKLSDGRTVRLIGIDCPEFKDQDRNKRNAKKLGIDSEHYASYAEKSKGFLYELVADTEVRTEIDPANKITMHHDKYQRFLAYIYVDDLFVNEELVAEGQCVTYKRFQFRYKDEFLELEAEAKEAGRGLWG